MDNTILIILGGILLILYIWYAGIVTKKNKTKEALSGIDVQLKKRSNLIPNILKIAQKFMEHEKELITQVTKLRSKADKEYNPENIDAVKKHLKNVGELDNSLGQLMISVEDYPDLKSDATMLQAQRTYNEVEEHIAASRRFYNAAVTSLNNAIEIFPGNFIAPLAKAKAMPFYETDELSRAPVDADTILK